MKGKGGSGKDIDKEPEQVPMPFPATRVLDVVIRGGDGTLVVDELSPKLKEILLANAEKILPLLVGELTVRLPPKLGSVGELRLEVLAERADMFNLLVWIQKRLSKQGANHGQRIAVVLAAVEAYLDGGDLPDRGFNPTAPQKPTPQSAKPKGRAHLSIVRDPTKPRSKT